MEMGTEALPRGDGATAVEWPLVYVYGKGGSPPLGAPESLYRHAHILYARVCNLPSDFVRAAMGPLMSAPPDRRSWGAQTASVGWDQMDPPG